MYKKKRRLEEEKEERKRKRQEKAENKKKISSKRKFRRNGTDSETETSDESINSFRDVPEDGHNLTESNYAEIVKQYEDNHEACAKCNKKTFWYNKRAWIGCGCARWFHRQTLLAQK